MNFNNLNDKQIEAVKYTEGPLLILAGAGSGKTTTMTNRIAYLIEKGVSPYAILAVTFTNKAAGEMRERVESLVGNVMGMWIMTFHAMCLRMLRKHADSIGYDPNFTIYDTTDQKTIVRNIIKDLNVDPKQFRVAYVLAVISNNKNQGISPDEFEKYSDGNPRDKILGACYRLYEQRLKENNAMDFDDLLLNTVKMFKADERVLLEYQDRFRYVMVDEYQDTNHIQYELMHMISEKHKNICVVGDDDQCIYQWRGADINNILDFEKDFPKAKVIKLEQNYRSVANILDGAHSVIENNRSRKGKKLWTEKDHGDKITYYRAEDERDEASFVASKIRLILEMEEGKKYSDFAVLYRTNVQSRQFEEAFTRADIPYRVLSGLRYYDRKEIKDLMAYMRLVVNPKDDLSLIRVINEPKRGIGVKTMEKVSALAKVQGKSIFNALEDSDVRSGLSPKASGLIGELVEAIDGLREEKENLKVSEIYDILLVKTGYLKALEDEGTIESEGRIENLMEFKSVILDFERTEADPTIEGLMEKLALMSDIDNHDENEDAVVLMTMHSSKGLEFPVVFLPGLEDGLFPGQRSFDSEDGMEEERRLCYVGMTRAMEKLFLSSASVRTMYGRTDYTRESQFLREMDPGVLTGDSVFKKKENVGIGRVAGPGVPTGSVDGASHDSLAGYKPYDALKKSREATKKAAGDTNFEIGDIVSHSKFGEGKVIDVTASTVSVEFAEAGLKKLAKGIAPLKKVE